MHKWGMIGCFLFFTLGGIFAQDPGYIDQLSECKSVRVSDAVKLFLYAAGDDVTDDFSVNLAVLAKDIGINAQKYHEDKTLTIGIFSEIAAKYIRLKGGVMYLATGAGRYAARELAFMHILPEGFSEFDAMTGIELLSYTSKVVEYGKK